MAERTPLFMDIDDAYSGDELGLPYRDIITEGIVGASSLEVTAGTGNTLDIASGACWVQGDTDPDFQPAYRCFNDATVNKGVNPDPSDDRMLLVVAQIIDQAFDGASREWEIQVLHGTPAASPVLPDLPDSALPLAEVLVPAAAADSGDYTITDVREAYGLGGVVSGGAATEMGTTLPASPSDGDEFILVDDITDPAYQWRFRYNADSVSDYPWEFVGGAALEAEVTTSETRTASGSYGALATAGPSITLPLAGEYDISHGCLVGTLGTPPVYHSYDIGGTGAVDADAVRVTGAGNEAQQGSISRTRKKEIVSAATALVSKYKSGGTNTTFQDRWIRAIPRRVAA